MKRCGCLLAVALLGCSEREPAMESPSQPGSEAKLEAFARARALGGLEPLRVLQRAGSLWRAELPQGKRPALRVELPTAADGEVLVEEPRWGVRVRWRLANDARSVARVVENVALYEAAGPDRGDAIVVVHDDSVEDFVRVHRRETTELRYSINVSEIAGLRLVANTLEMLDPGGAPRLRVAAPYVVDASGQVRAARLGLVGCHYDESPRLPWRRPVTAPGTARCELVVSWNPEGLSLPLVVDPSWTRAADMAEKRVGHTLSVVEANHDGEPEYACVIGGGNSAHAALDGAECYDRVNDSWAAVPGAGAGTGYARHHHTATVLLDNSILVAGGIGHLVPAAGVDPEPDSPLSSTERFHPQDGSWDIGPSLPQIRDHHTATRLRSGSVVIIGGGSKQAVMLDKAAAQWESVAEPMSTGRFGHAAVLVGSSTIFVAGGTAYADLSEPLDTAEMIVITGPTGIWVDAGKMNAKRAAPTALLLPERQSTHDSQPEMVLVAGQNMEPQLFDPAGPQWFEAPTKNIWRRTGQAGIKLQSKSGDSFALLIGGENDGTNVYPHTEVFTRSSGGWSLAPQELNDKREEHAAEVLSDHHSVLVTGGKCVSTIYRSSEIVSLGQPGDACQRPTDCLNGNCAGGLCCDGPCTGGCESCREADGAERDGTCTLLAAASPCGKLPEACEIASQCDGKSTVCPELTRAADFTSCTTALGEGVCVSGQCMMGGAGGEAGAAGEPPAGSAGSGPSRERLPAIRCSQRSPGDSGHDRGLALLCGFSLLALRRRMRGAA